MLFSSPILTEHLKSILIVDNDGMTVDLLSLGFKRCGFKVYRAENGLDAWNLFNRECMNSENIDFVLTDMQMPGLNGKELSHRIRNTSQATKIAVMSGGGIEVVRELLNEEVADYFFPKPFKIKQICKILMAETKET